MPRNNQGIYAPPPGNPVVPGTTIEAAWANDTVDDLGNALTGSLPRDGSAPMTAQLTLPSTPASLPNQATSKAYVDQFIAYATGMPVGAVLPFAGGEGTLSAAYLVCRGQAISRDNYSALFAAIGTIYGEGDGVATFNIPDLQDQFIRGKGTNRVVGGAQSSANLSHTHTVTDGGHDHTGSQLAHTHSGVPHTHPVVDPGHTHLSTGGGFVALGGSGEDSDPGTGLNVTPATASSPAGVSVSPATSEVGAAQPAVTVDEAESGVVVDSTGGSESRPPNIAMDYYIKALEDSAVTVPSVLQITSTTPDMLTVDDTDPQYPELAVASNLPLAACQLDANGLVPLGLLPSQSQTYLGGFNAAAGDNPSEAFPTRTYFNGDLYDVSVEGTIDVYDPVTYVSAPTLVLVGSNLSYYDNGVDPIGWYYLAAGSIGITASTVSVAPIAGLDANETQAALAELQLEKLSILGGIPAITTVAAMKAEDLQSGQTVLSIGYYFLGDNGGAQYLIQTAIEYGGTPDEYIDHTLANGNIAVFQPNGDTIRLLQAGARINGTPVDSGALQAAIDSPIKHVIIDNTGSTLQFDSLTIGTGVDNREGLILEGVTAPVSGAPYTYLECTSLTETAIDVKDGGVDLRNFRLGATAARRASATPAIGIHTRGDLVTGTFTNSTLDRVWVQHQPGDGIVLEGTERTLLTYVDSTSNEGRGFYLKTVPSPAGICNALTGCRAFGNMFEGWDVESWYNTFIGCQSILNNQSPSLYGSTSQEVNMASSGQGNVWINPDIEAQDQAMLTPGVDRPMTMLGMNINGGDQQVISGVIGGFDTGILLGASAANATISSPNCSNAGVGYSMLYGVDNSAVNTANITMRSNAALTTAVRNKVFTGQSGSKWYTPRGLVVTTPADVVTGSGAMSVDIAPSHIAGTAGVDAITLASPAFDGVFKYITKISGGGSSVITPTALSNGTTITFNAIGDSATLFFTNGAWSWMGGTSTLA